MILLFRSSSGAFMISTECAFLRASWPLQSSFYGVCYLSSQVGTLLIAHLAVSMISDYLRFEIC